MVLTDQVLELRIVAGSADSYMYIRKVISNSNGSSGLLQYLLPDLGIVWMLLQNLMAYINSTHVPLGLQMVEGQLETYTNTNTR